MPVVFDLQTTAVFSGDIDVCILYDETTIGVPEMDLRLLHFNAGLSMWEDATTSVDLISNIICGSVSSLSPFVVAMMTSTGGVDGGTPRHLTFGPATPQPMRSSTTFSIEIPTRTQLDVRISDVAGRIVRTLAAGHEFEPGRHTLVWGGEDDRGQRLSPGLYFARLSADGRIVRQRVVVLR